jgi:hypothetical protein
VSFSRVGSTALPLKTGINAWRPFSIPKAIKEDDSHLIVDFAREFIFGYLSMNARRTVQISGEELIANQSERCIC